MIKHNYIPLDLHSRLTANIALTIASELKLRDEEISVAWWLGLLHDAGWILVRPKKVDEYYSFEHGIKSRMAHKILEKFLDEVIVVPSYKQLYDFLKSVDLSIEDIVRLVNILVTTRGRERISKFKAELSKRGLSEDICYAVVDADAIATTFEEREVSGYLRQQYVIKYFELIRYFTTPLVNPARPYVITYRRILLHSTILEEFINEIRSLSESEYKVFRNYEVTFDPIIEYTLDGVCYVLPSKLNSELERSIKDRIYSIIRDIKVSLKVSFSIDYDDDDYAQAILGTWRPQRLAEIGCLFCKGRSFKTRSYDIVQLFPSFIYRNRPTFKSTYVSSNRGRRSEAHVTPCPLCVISSANWRMRGLDERKLPVLILTYIPRYYEVGLRRSRAERLLDKWQHIIDDLNEGLNAQEILEKLKEDSALRRKSRKELPLQSILLVADIATKNTSYILLRDIYEDTYKVIESINDVQIIMKTPIAHISSCNWSSVQELCSRLEEQGQFTPIIVNSWKYIHALNTVSIAGEVFTGVKHDIHAALKVLKFIATIMKHMKRKEFKYQVLSSGNTDDILRIFCTTVRDRSDLRTVAELATYDYIYESFSSILQALRVLSA